MAFGLLPWERKLVDAMMEDTFSMATGFVRLIEALPRGVSSRWQDDEGQDLEVTLYLWREEFLNGVTEEDWSMERFEVGRAAK